MKNTKPYISLYEVTKLKRRQKLLLNELNVVLASALPSTIATSKGWKGKHKPPNVHIDKIDPCDAILIGDGSNSHTPPFLLTLKYSTKTFTIV